MADSYYPAPSSNGAPVFTVPAQTTSQMHALPPGYSMAVDPKPSDCDCSFNKKNAIWLSCMLIAAGILGIIGAAIGLYAFAHLAEVGTGIWCGVMFLATGCVGLVAGHHQTIHLMRATVSTAAVTIVFTVTLLTISVIGLTSGYSCWQFCYYPYPYYYYCQCYSWHHEAVAANAVLIASASVAFIFSLWLLIIASIRLRSMSKIPASNVTMVTSPQFHQVVGSNPQPQPIIVFSNHSQPALLQGQQMPQGVTQLPHAQAPFVIMGQQPVVMHGSQLQPIVVVRQEPPHGGAAGNVQSPGSVYESLIVQNTAANGEPDGRHGNKNGDGD